MSFEQDIKLCKQHIKSFENILSRRNKLENKTRMSLPGFRTCGYLRAPVGDSGEWTGGWLPGFFTVKSTDIFIFFISYSAGAL